MKPYDHDYKGERRKEYEMQIGSRFVDDLLWIKMEGTHSWENGTYTNTWIHAMTLQTWKDIVKVVNLTLEEVGIKE